MSLFKSFKRHFQFVVAFQFLTEKGNPFSYTPTRLERWGGKLLTPYSLSFEMILRYLNWQVILILLASGALIATTIFYYPDQVSQFIEVIIPALKWEYTKLFFFLVIQWYIQSLFLRTWGRLSNERLLNAWLAEEIHS